MSSLLMEMEAEENTAMKGGKVQVANDRHICEGKYLQSCICGMQSCASIMRKWAKFGAFHGCEAGYVQIPLLHTTRKTMLQLYTSGYAEAIAEWAVTVSPGLK